MELKLKSYSFCLRLGLWTAYTDRGMPKTEGTIVQIITVVCTLRTSPGPGPEQALHLHVPVPALWMPGPAPNCDLTFPGCSKGSGYAYIAE